MTGHGKTGSRTVTDNQKSWERGERENKIKGEGKEHFTIVLLVEYYQSSSPW